MAPRRKKYTPVEQAENIAMDLESLLSELGTYNTQISHMPEADKNLFVAYMAVHKALAIWDDIAKGRLPKDDNNR